MAEVEKVQRLGRTLAKYAFVVPRFGEGIAGGIETLVGVLAQRLQARGDSVEVLTTCARDNRTWANELAAGVSKEFGVLTRRFPVNERNLDVWVRHQIHLNDGIPLSVDDQIEWMQESVSSDALYSEILSRYDEFDAFFFAPYLFGTTFWGSLLVPDKAILIPCLHDEANAYVDVIASMFRQVRGALFNASPERDLAQRLYGPIAGGEVGMGFEPYADEYVSGLRPYFDSDFPYVLYVGRKETGKNAHLLLDYFCAAKDRFPELSDLRLVIAGAGSFDDLERPTARKRQDIVDVGHVTEDEKRRLIRHARALCQPSTNESFSIVLMEAWMLGTPVLVNAACEVTKHHVIESGGGLYFGSAADFAAVLGELSVSAELRNDLSAAGLDYVRTKYAWSEVLLRFDRVMQNLNGVVRSPLEAKRGAAL
ncbi:MAG: glycosyltransferase family 4 protein [Oligoflexia bacterium]|nr:glycosyltransferase family 4 protein [Oligoflexia bacterium]